MENKVLNGYCRVLLTGPIQYKSCQEDRVIFYNRDASSYLGLTQTKFFLLH